MELRAVVHRIDQRLAELGISATKASRDAGLSTDAIRNMKRAVKTGSHSGASMKTISALAPVLKTSVGWLLDGEDTVRHTAAEGFDRAETMRIPVRGEVAAGQWLETVPFLDDLEIDDWLDGLSVPEGMKPYTYALRVKGTSINRIAPDGDYLICLDISSGAEIHHRDVVVVERIRDQGALREVTAKRLIQRGDEIVLMPESNDPAWQTEIVLKDDPYQMDAEIRIVAKVKHAIRPL